MPIYLKYFFILVETLSFFPVLVLNTDLSRGWGTFMDIFWHWDRISPLFIPTFLSWFTLPFGKGAKIKSQSTKEDYLILAVGPGVAREYLYGD